MKGLNILLPRRMAIPKITSYLYFLLYPIGEVSQMNSDRLTLPSTVISNGMFLSSSSQHRSRYLFCLEGEPLTTVTTTDKIEASEPCWDGYQVNRMFVFVLFICFISFRVRYSIH